jgi:hypothetical protein
MEAICARRACQSMLAASLLLWIIPASAEKLQNTPIVIHEVSHAVSQPLSRIVKTVPAPMFHGWIVRKEHGSANKVTKIFNEPDSVAQDESEYLPPLSITIGLNKDGMDGVHAGGVIPPDTNGSAGSSQFVLITNFAYQVFDKTTGKSLLGPTLIHNIWNGFATCGTQDGGDPVVLWDKMANRWLVGQLSFPSTLVCLAVSATDDATGQYHLYAFSFNALPDYPKLGVWPDAYYLAVNYFGNGFAQGEPCALDRTAMLAGKAATMICFSPSSTDAGYLPSDFDGTTAPPTGAPNHYVELGNSNTTLKEYDFHVDFVHPKKSTFRGPHTLTVPAYTQLCSGGLGACIPEPSGGGTLDALGDRLMFRNAYRNFGDHESMVFSHSVAPKPGSIAVSAIRWYELRSTPSVGKFSVYQTGTFQNKKDNYWMGSLAMDKAGDIALGFSVDNSTNLDPSIWVTGRLPTDPKGKMGAPMVLHKGTTVQGRNNRWGDYSSMSVDPADDCTLWYTQEYSDGGLNWQSHFTSFKFNSCN